MYLQHASPSCPPDDPIGQRTELCCSEQREGGVHVFSTPISYVSADSTGAGHLSSSPFYVYNQQSLGLGHEGIPILIQSEGDWTRNRHIVCPSKENDTSSRMNVVWHAVKSSSFLVVVVVVQFSPLDRLGRRGDMRNYSAEIYQVFFFFLLRKAIVSSSGKVVTYLI